jgi:hypothetical protein
MHEDLIKRVNEVNPLIFQETDYYKKQLAGEKTKAEEQAKAQVELNPFGNFSSTSGGNTSGSPFMNPQQAKQHERHRGPVMVGENPETGERGLVPKTFYNKDYLPKNSAEAMRKMMSDSRIADAMGWSPKIRENVSMFKPWTWGSDKNSKFWEDVNKMPEEDQFVINNMMTLYNKMDPEVVNRWMNDLINKASLTGKLDKQEVSKQLEKIVLMLHQDLNAAGNL